MAVTPRYLLKQDNGKFSVFETGGRSYEYDIVSYCWGGQVKRRKCDEIDGVTWPVKISQAKLNAIQELMCFKGVKYMWADCVCIDKRDNNQASEEVAKMFEYYKYAKNCYLLIDTPEQFDPKQIADDLKFLDHILSNIGGASMVSDTMRLSNKLEERLRQWAEEKRWVGVLSKARVTSAGIDLGVMNCYNTCVEHVRSLLENEYFTRVWTFQEMILGKNIQIVGSTGGKLSSIGSLYQWFDLASDCRDKAEKLYGWIWNPRAVETASVSLALTFIEDDKDTLIALQRQIRSINAARTDIISGGQYWWQENPSGVSNIFSAISLRPRGCRDMQDLFRGLLGIFSGLFTPEEIREKISGDDIEKISFAFFKQLSTKTGHAWTKLSISSKERGQWDWIPVVEHDPNAQQGEEEEEEEDEDEDDDNDDKNGEKEPKSRKNRIKTDIFAGVDNLGPLRESRAKTRGQTGLLGVPRKFMSIHLKEENPEFHFIFKGCNCGKKVNAGLFKKRTKLQAQDEPIDVTGDETGRTLAECATLLGCVLDPNPNSNVLEYKSTLLRNLKPQWDKTDPEAKPFRWPERCVSGTFWANPDCRHWLRTHNMSWNYRMGAIYECESRLAQGTTANISCEVRINCGCTITAPFSLIFEALSAVPGSSLGDTEENDDKDGRIVMKDGLGLVQIGDLGKTFNVVAFGGDLNYHKSNATLCRRVKQSKQVNPVKAHPTGRALIRSDFTHGIVHMMRDYGYVVTGVGNLLISRNHPFGSYKVRGVCIDDRIPKKKEGVSRVMIK
ncbi:heterokaryon incompatibility protein-domain-containing protein [Xylaria acuta]|nr:heterokaryon incompatibility protein-domain-containing protein [Xylaria acuta]